MSRLDKIAIGFLTVLGFVGVYLVWMPFMDLSHRGIKANHDGQLLDVTRDVRLRNQRQLGWQAALAHQGVSYGDEVFVGEESKALVILEQLKFEIDANSLLSLQKLEGSSTLDLARGSIKLDIEGDQKVKLNLAGRTLEVEGAGAELHVTRDAAGEAKSLGLSFLKGKAKVTMRGEGLDSKGQVIRGTEGGNIIFDVEGSGLKFKKYDLDLVAPENAAMLLYMEKIRFEWKKLDSGIRRLTLQVAEDPEFQRLTLNESLPPDARGFTWTPPAFEGSRYWRLTAVTAENVSLKSAAHQMQVVQLRAPKIFSPIYTFKTPEKSTAKIILEEMPGASRYLLQYASDVEFKKNKKEMPSISAIVEADVFSGAILYVRARAEYAKISKTPPWSETIQLRIPEAPRAPERLTVVPGALGKALISWNPVPLADGYKLYITEADGTKATQEVRESRAEVACFPRDGRTVQVQTTRENGAYSNLSKSVLVLACPPPLVLTEASIFPSTLNRHGGAQGYRVLLKWEGDTFQRPPIVNVSTTPDFSRNQNVTVGPQGDIYSPLPITHVRIRQEAPADQFLTRWSAPLSVTPAAVPELKPTALRLPASEEVILQLESNATEISLSWEKVPEAVEYDLQVAKDKDFKNIVFKATPKGTSQQLEEWSTGVFYWRVRAVGLYKETPWTAPRTFRVVHGQ